MTLDARTRGHVEMAAVILWTLGGIASMLWAIYLAVKGRWSEATFFLVLYGILRRISHREAKDAGLEP